MLSSELSTAFAPSLSERRMGKSKYLSAALMLLVAAICFWRMPDRLQAGFLWAEDGPIFIKQAIELGLGSIFTPYAGYLHLDARLITYAVTRTVPLEQIPYVMPWVCTAVYGLLAIYTQLTCFRLLPGNAWQRSIVSTCMALAIVAVPQTGEVYLSVTNLQWSIAPVLLLCLFEISACSSGLTRAQVVARGIFVVTSTLTGPFGAIFLPFAVLVAGYSHLKRPGNTAWPVLWGYVAAIAAQAFFIKTSQGADPNAGVNPLTFPWPEHFFRYFVGELFVDSAMLTSREGQISTAVSLAALFACVLTGTHRRVKTMLLAVAVGMWFIGVTRGGTLSNPVTWTGFGSRYLFIPHILILWALMIDLLGDSRALRRLISLALIFAAMTTSLRQFELTTWAGLPWSVEKISASVYRLTTAPAPWQSVIRVPTPR
ncbi:hypothetical protein [Cupriavidus pinatubonensis]|uniref:hypothetical protein n=1 Tax=Cupriavidus pinatubonensis TaxID=248026 RepID=UPI003607131A